MKEIKNARQEWLKKDLLKLNSSKIFFDDLIKYACKFYEKGYSGINIITLLENPVFLDKILTVEKKFELLITFNKVRKEFRNEKLLILFILNFIFLSSELSLENISFM